METINQSKFSKFLTIFKCCMLGIIITLVGIVLFAVVLKFADLSTRSIAYVNDVIKAIAIFAVVACLKKKTNKLIINALFAGIIYTILAFLVFSILNGSFSFNLSFLYDLLFCVIVSLIVAMMLNLLSRKS